MKTPLIMALAVVAALTACQKKADTTTTDTAPQSQTQRVEFRVTKLIHTQYHTYAQHEQDQCDFVALRIEQHQAEQRKQRANHIQQDDDLPLRQATLQKHVMNMAAVAFKQRRAADKPAAERNAHFDHWQSERNQRNGDGNQCWAFLRADQR